MNFIRISHLFWKQPWRAALEVNCQACNFTGILEDFGHIHPTCSEKINILKVGKIFQSATTFYQNFFVSDKICYYETNSGNSYN